MSATRFKVTKASGPPGTQVQEFRGDKVLRTLVIAAMQPLDMALLEAFINRSRCDCRKTPRG